MCKLIFGESVESAKVVVDSVRDVRKAPTSVRALVNMLCFGFKDYQSPFVCNEEVKLCSP